MKTRRVGSGRQPYQKQVRVTGPSSASSADPEFDPLPSPSLAMLHRHPLGKLVRLREIYASSNVEPAATIARRIRTALDLLVNEQWKRCIQECDKLLKKHSNFFCVTILRSMALFRNNSEQAVELVRSESDRAPVVDPLTLMCFVYFCMYQAQDEKVVVKALSAYLNKKECFKDSDVYGAIMFVYLRYGMFKHFQQIAWLMHSQERSTRSFKSVLFSLLLMIDVCDDAKPFGVLNVGLASSESKSEAKRSADCVAKLGVKFMEKKIHEDDILNSPNKAGPLVDTYLVFLNKCANYRGTHELLDRMLAVLSIDKSGDDDDDKYRNQLQTLKYQYVRADTYKLMGRYCEALNQFRNILVSTAANIEQYSSRKIAGGNLFPHDAKDSIAECMYKLYFDALLAESSNVDSKESGQIADITKLCETVLDAVGQYSFRKADNVMARAKIISHLLALIHTHNSDIKLAAAFRHADLPFISRDAIMQCVQDMYRFTSRDSPAFYDCAKHLMRFFDDQILCDQWQTFLSSNFDSDLSPMLNIIHGTRITDANEEEILGTKSAAWYRHIAVKLGVDEFLFNVVRSRSSDDKRTDADRNHSGKDDIVKENEDEAGDIISSPATNRETDVLGQVETLLRLFVRARVGEAANEGMGPPHNSEEFGVLAVLKLYHYAVGKNDSRLLWLCTLIAIKLAQSTIFLPDPPDPPVLPVKLVDSTQILFQYLLMNIFVRFGAMPAALEVFQSGMQVKNLQIHRYGYYLSGAAAFLMPGPSGMHVSSHLCAYISLSVTEANRFAEETVQSSSMGACVADMLECAHLLPTLQSSVLGRSLTLHTIWQLFFMPIPQALGPCGVLKRFEAYKEDMNNCIMKEASYRNELSAVATVPSFSLDDVCDSNRRQFLQTVVRDQAIYGQLFDLFAVAFHQSFYMRHDVDSNNLDNNDAASAASGDTANNNINRANSIRSDDTAISSRSSGSGVTHAQLMREQVHCAFYDDMREQTLQRLSDLPEVTPTAMPDSVEYFENHLTFPYADQLPLANSIGIFGAFVNACDISKALRTVLLRADIIVTSSQLASRLNAVHSSATDAAVDDDEELAGVLQELRVAVDTTLETYRLSLNNLFNRYVHVQATSDHAFVPKSLFWYRHLLEAVAGVVWLVQALRLLCHRYTTVLRVSANPVKAMLMAQSDAGGGDANSRTVSGIIQQQPQASLQQLLAQHQIAGAANIKQQQPSVSAKQQQLQTGRRGKQQRATQPAAGKAHQQQQRAAAPGIKTSYNTLEQLLAPAVDALTVYAAGVESGAHELVLFLGRVPFVGSESILSSSPTASPLFGEPLESEFDAAANNVPAEWERFRFMFASPDEAKSLHDSTRRRFLASWTKTHNELISVLEAKCAPCGSSSDADSGRITADFQDAQSNWL